MLRRRFLQSTLLAAPYVTSGLRAASPNGKLRHVSFGGNGMAWSDVSSLRTHPNFELVAVCDVDSRNFDRVKKEFPNAKVYQDWRECLEKEAGNIDSVNVSTPDHMHGPIGLKALDMGLHMYGQKPLAQNLHECRQLMLKAREKGVMTQMGIQISSDFTERYTVELIHSGVIGKVKEVHTFSNKKWGDMDPVPVQTDAVPAGFDWQRWLGPATDRPFINGYYHPGNWRKRRDFGTGTLGDMGCHMFSGWFRSLGLAAPISVKSLGLAPPNATNWAINGHVEYIFAGTQYTDGSTVKVTWYDGDVAPPPAVTDLLVDAKGKKAKLGQGTIYIGTEGVLHHPHVSRPFLYPSDKFAKLTFPKLKPRHHWHEFIDCCINGGEKPSANFDYAAPLTEAVLLGCLASAFPQADLTWDSPGLRIPNNEAAHALVKRQYRDGWVM